MEWQTYDVCFRSARVDDAGKVLENARVSVIHNGLTIQNNVIMNGPTGGAMAEKEDKPGPILLQDHGNLACFRNIWAVHLPFKGSDAY